MSELTNVFTNIADAIRSKTGSSATMTPAQMATKIEGISTGIEKIKLSQSAYDNLPLVDKEDPTKLYIIDERNYLYKWDFTKSRIDEIQGVEADGGNLQSDGVHITQSQHCVKFNQGYNKNYVYEIDIYSMNKKTNATSPFLAIGQWQGLSYNKNESLWGIYINYKWVYSNISSGIDLSDGNAFIGKTIKILCDSEDKVCLYADDELFFKTPYAEPNPVSNEVMLGSNGANYYYDFVVSGVRIYENEE